MNFYGNSSVDTNSAAAANIDVSAVLRQVYMWMFAALLITAGTAYFISQSPSITNALFGNPLLLIGSFIVEIGLVMFISARIMQLDPTTAITLFLVYAFVNGVTLSFIFLTYTTATIYGAAIATAGMFGATSLFAYATRIDLSKMGGILMMALIGLIIASIVNMFVASSALYWIINYAGVLIFVGLTAYDTQRIKDMALNISVNAGGEAALVQRVGVIGALKLYLDFINIFLLVLRIMGGGRGGRR